MKILTVEQIRTAEQDAISSGVLSFKDLMLCAAKKFYDSIINSISVNKDICIVCGKGNNGGDGLVLSKLLKDSGYPVSVCFPLGLPTSSPANEFIHYADSLNIVNKIPLSCDILIDALFGIGLDRPLEGSVIKIISDMNNCKARKIALDIPSGVNADGKFADNTFIAHQTFTFIALKPCFVLPKTSGFCGEVTVLDIGVAPKEYAYLTTETPQKTARNKNSHKGSYGTALMLTGSYGMCGASILAARAALVSGVGIVKNFVCDKNYTAFTLSVPEAVTIPVDTLPCGTPDIYDRQLVSALSSSTAFLVGCGLGNNEESAKLIKRSLLLTRIPTVIDADGINCLAGSIEFIKEIKAPVVITPHPKEMARLLNVNVEDVEENRPEYAKRVAVKYGCTVVLKGANTVIASKDGKVYFNLTGNPGLATGGSGDVLAGMITARICLGETPETAAENAVWLHGFAADRLAKRYNLEGILPSDVIEELKTI